MAKGTKKPLRSARQGDVLVIERQHLPEGALKKVKTDQNSHVLAWGEVTGHAHRILDYDAATMLEAENGVRYLDMTRAAALVHEEHSPIEFQPGIKEIRIQEAYNWEEEFLERVRD